MTSHNSKFGEGVLDLSLLDLLTPFGNVLKDVVERAGAVDREARSAVTIDTARGPVRAQTEFRLRVGSVEDALAARGMAEAPGSVAREWRQRPKPPGKAETASAPSGTAASPATARDAELPPRHEVLEDGDALIVTASVPGARAVDSTVMVEGGELRLTAAGARRYGLRLPLPADVRADELSWTLVNGLLEVTLPLDRMVQAPTP